MLPHLKYTELNNCRSIKYKMTENGDVYLIVTSHGEYRTRKRCGIPKKSVKKNANKAFEYGICHKECTGRLKKYIDWLFLSHKSNYPTNIRLYGNHVYIFGEIALITTIPLPNIYKNAVNKLKKRKRDVID